MEMQNRYIFATILLLSWSNCLAQQLQPQHNKSVPEPQTGINWDLTVSLGNSLQLYFLNDKPTKDNGAKDNMDMDSKLKSQEIPLPLPNNSLIVPLETLHETWTKYIITSLESESNRIYYSHFYEKLTNIGYYDTITQENWILYQTLTGSIYYMTLHNGNLYFTETFGNSYTIISKLNVSLVGSLPEEVIKAHGDSELCGLVIDEQKEILYWSTFKKNQMSGIYSMDLQNPTQERKLVLDNSETMRKPHALTLDGDWIYFLNTPVVGVKNRIDRINIREKNEKEVVGANEFLSLTNLFPFTLTILCDDLFMTDIVSRALFVIKDINFVESHHDIKFKRLTAITSSQTTPYSLHAMWMKTSKYCQEKMSARITTETAPSEFATQSPIQIPSSTTPVAPLIKPNTDNDKLSYKVFIETKGPKLCSVAENGEFCSKGSICIELNEQRYCICEHGKYGNFCELNVLDTTTHVQHSSNHMHDVDDFKSSWLFIAPVSIMTLISIILLIAVIFLGMKVRKLSAKPRIKRRFIVQRRSRPAANSNQSTISSGNQTLNACEMIDIENCCNMNVCETPCYDQIPGINPDDNDLLIPV